MRAGRGDVGQQDVGHNWDAWEHQSVICHNNGIHDEQAITSEAEIYIISSMGGRSLGNGNRF